MTAPVLAVVEHEADCPLGLFAGWFAAAGADVRVARPYRGDAVPDLDGADGLVVLGGSMGAGDDDVAPWLPATRALLRAAVAAAVPTLGICLGHQMLVAACGGRVEANPAGRQQGVLPVGWAPAAGSEHLFGGVRAAARSLQWNDDVAVALPPATEVLAATPEGIPQAIRVGDAAWGVQFHPEVDARIIARWAKDAPVDARTVAEVRAAEPELIATWRPLAERFAAIASL